MGERKANLGGQVLNVASDERALFDCLAERIAALANEAVQTDGFFTMLLSGGSTPRGLYQRLSQLPEGKMPWASTYLFLGDERCVGHNDGESNYKMISDSLLSRIDIPSTNVFPTIKQDSDPKESARIYDQTIRRFFKFEKDETAPMPEFDLALMGLGEDGHTASLFPGTEALEERKRICVENYVPKFAAHRLTLTMPVFAACKKVVFLVSGSKKTEIVGKVLKREGDFPSLSVIDMCPQGTVEWYLDEACASSLI
ncbi:MAG: 6-phosphogluconolactonase [Candidatus Obscuribacter phosphatis]|uniref:6-phosphogluconolactonase n=1 Tax=Candidatus Obscuribacter phosphatis TaxID=1906157 RepID=A0A8J7PKR4_9BACT|nr:6-phosphogluconolactonase [Candidatus Obscuribacter phosphatis]